MTKSQALEAIKQAREIRAAVPVLKMAGREHKQSLFFKIRKREARQKIESYTSDIDEVIAMWTTEPGVLILG